MTIEDILFFEREGVINTINDYTRENYVRSYTELLRKLEYPNDKNKMIKVCYRLLEWYKDNIDEITDNEYLHNKKEHLKTKRLLEQLLTELIESAA